MSRACDYHVTISCDTLCRMRLRKKTWRSPGTVYLDHQLIDKDIHVYAGSEMYVEPLKGQYISVYLCTSLYVYNY